MSYFGQGMKMSGDPGFFGTLGRIGSGIITGLTGINPSGFGGPALPRFPFPPRGGGDFSAPGGRFPTRGPGTAMVGPIRKRRRMNVGNAKALRRAIRRQSGFVKLAEKALAGTDFKIVRRSSTRRAKPVVIRESGPGSVSVH